MADNAVSRFEASMIPVTDELPSDQRPCVLRTTLGLTEAYYVASAERWLIPVKGEDVALLDPLEWEHLTHENKVAPDPAKAVIG